MKNYSELTLTDDYLFSQVMKDESVCKPFLRFWKCFWKSK